MLRNGVVAGMFGNREGKYRRRLTGLISEERKIFIDKKPLICHKRQGIEKHMKRRNSPI